MPQRSSVDNEVQSIDAPAEVVSWLPVENNLPGGQILDSFFTLGSFKVRAAEAESWWVLQRFCS